MSWPDGKLQSLYHQCFSPGAHAWGLREMLLASVPNVEALVDKTWLSRVEGADPSCELELQTAVAAKDSAFTIRSNPSTVTEYTVCSEHRILDSSVFPVPVPCVG